MKRRDFLQIFELSIVAAFLFMWRKIGLFTSKISQNERKILPLNKNKELSFIDEYILVNKNNEIKVLSAHCTHLGCKINKLENGELVCPCHGSHFDLDGNPLKGPAYKSLETIPSKVSEDGNFVHLIKA